MMPGMVMMVMMPHSDVVVVVMMSDLNRNLGQAGRFTCSPFGATLIIGFQ
jgi:hypothetical protein